MCVCVCMCNAADSITATCVLIIPGFIECVWGVRRLSFYSETNTTAISPTVINTHTHTYTERERERVVVCVFCPMTRSPVVVSSLFQSHFSLSSQGKSPNTWNIVIKSKFLRRWRTLFSCCVSVFCHRLTWFLHDIFWKIFSHHFCCAKCNLPNLKGNPHW